MSRIHLQPVFLASRRGFSLIELMVVIAILGLIVALAIPVLGSIEAQGRAVDELSGARATAAAWRDYATDRDGELLMGYYPDSDPEAEPLYDFNGDFILGGEPRKRWFWRLAAYVENAKEVFFPTALDTVRREIVDVPDHQYATTLHPAYGLNGEWVGGLGEDVSNNLYALYEYGDLKECPWAQRLSDIKKPSQLMIFASARFGSMQGGGGSWLGGIVEGFHRIQSPCHPTSGFQWAATPEGSPVDLMTDDPADHGFVSARHNGKAVTAMVDGSTALERPSQLADMRRWANGAWKRDWVLVP